MLYSDYEKMPRSELIEELVAFEKKFNSKVRVEVEKNTKKELKKLYALESEAIRIIDNSANIFMKEFIKNSHNILSQIENPTYNFYLFDNETIMQKCKRRLFSSIPLKILRQFHQMMKTMEECGFSYVLEDIKNEKEKI